MYFKYICIISNGFCQNNPHRGRLLHNGFYPSVSAGIIFVAHHPCGCQVGSWWYNNSNNNNHDVSVGFLEAVEEHRQNNDSKPRGGDGDVRHLRPEARSGAGSRRPRPGVSGLLPGGHPAADGRVERWGGLRTRTGVRGNTSGKTRSVTCGCSRLPAATVNDESKRGHYREKIKGYMDRAEQIKVHVNQMKEGDGYN